MEKHPFAQMIAKDGAPHRYWKVGTTEGRDGPSYWDVMRRGKFVSIGWKDHVTDLKEVLNEDRTTLKNYVQDLIGSLYSNASMRSRKAGEIVDFVQEIAEGDLVLACQGETVVGLGRIEGPYGYDGNLKFPHKRPIKWLSTDTWKMPEAEGPQTTVFRFGEKSSANRLELERRLSRIDGLSTSIISTNAPASGEAAPHGEAQALLAILVDALQNAVPEDPATFITYAEAHRRLGIPILFGHAGESLKAQGLNSLAGWTHANDVPAITGLIVRDIERDPGKGYFSLFKKREIEDIPWWLEQIRQSKTFDWAPYLSKAGNAASSRKVETEANGQSPSATTGKQPFTEAELFAQARRIANLILTRVAISGEVVQHTAPKRTAPEDLVPNIYELLKEDPLICYLCGGVIQIKAGNRLLQPSPDRVDSGLGDYGKENLRLAHLACNLGKNASTVDEFREWLFLMRAAQAPDSLA